MTETCGITGPAVARCVVNIQMSSWGFTWIILSVYLFTHISQLDQYLTHAILSTRFTNAVVVFGTQARASTHPMYGLLRRVLDRTVTTRQLDIHELSRDLWHCWSSYRLKRCRCQYETNKHPLMRKRQQVFSTNYNIAAASEAHSNAGF